MSPPRLTPDHRGGLRDSAARAPLGGRHLRQRAGLGLVGGENDTNWCQILKHTGSLNKAICLPPNHPQTFAHVTGDTVDTAPRTGRFVAPGSYMRAAAASCQPCAAHGAFCSARKLHAGCCRIVPALRRARGVSPRPEATCGLLPHRASSAMRACYDHRAPSCGGEAPPDNVVGWCGLPHRHQCRM